MRNVSYKKEEAERDPREYRTLGIKAQCRPGLLQTIHNLKSIACVKESAEDQPSWTPGKMCLARYA
jgi:hypothetical protein